MALAYGNDEEKGHPGKSHAESPLGTELEKSVFIAPFARKNYYAEAVHRLKALSRGLRDEFGGQKADYRIFCNSGTPEKPLAEASGLGAVGRNSLIITKEAGSLVVLAAMTLPFILESDSLGENDGAIQGDFPFCKSCGNPDTAPCVRACPTQALKGDGKLIKERCIQWYASGNREEGKPEVPDFVASQWGQRLYGCTNCQDACPHNKKPIRGANTELGTNTDRGVLQASYDALSLLAMSDEELKALFKGTAMGMSWLGPAVFKQNARLALKWIEDQVKS